MTSSPDGWPSLPLAEWQETRDTLHLWTQIIGKIRLAAMPWINHSWHVTLYVTARGLSTLAMPIGLHTVEIRFDFVDHSLIIEKSDGQRRSIALRPMAVADFYQEVMAALRELDVEVEICTQPNEIPDAIPFEIDRQHAAYDAEYAHRFWRVLVQTERVFQKFRARFIGKCSPVHFFWGSCDLAVTRFSGRPAPPHPGGVPNLPDDVAHEAYSHEVSSAGFWPGGGGFDEAAFYAYAYPTPDGFKDAKIQPASAFYYEPLGEFILPYDAVRTAAAPEETLMLFLQSTYEAAANLGEWNREALEQKPEGIPESSF